MSGLNYTLGLDCSNFFSGLKNSENAAKTTSKAIQDAFGSKLKQVLSFAAIEEGIRRTGEWAAEIEKTSRALGMSAEALQTLQYIASKTGTSESAVTGMFENIGKARDEALRGNQELIQSFGRLGITFDDLRNKSKKELFSKTLGSINLGTATEGQRSAIQNITGTPPGVIKGFQAGMDGGNFSDIQEKLAKEGSITKEEDIGTLAQQWADIMTSMKEIGTDLIPVAEFALAIVKMVIDGIGGIVQLVSDAVKGIWSLLNGDFDKAKIAFGDFGLLVANMGYGLLKMVYGVVDFISGLLSKIPMLKGIKSDFVKELQDAQNTANQTYHTSTKTVKRGQAAGELIGTVISAGEGAVNSIGREVGGVLGHTAESMGAKGIAGKIRKIGQPTGPDKYMRDYTMRKAYNDMGIYEAEGSLWHKGGGRLSESETIAAHEAALSEAKPNFAAHEASKGAGHLNRAYGIGSTITGQLGLTGAFGIPLRASRSIRRTQEGLVAPEDEKPIMPFRGMGMGMGGEGGGMGTAMLKIGGMAGSGENKIVRLNIQMVDLLSKIQENTSVYDRSGLGYGNSSGAGNFAGGL